MAKKDLFSEFWIKNLKLENRLVMAPMTRNFSPNGVPDKYAIEYYKKRAAGGTGLIITEGVEVSHPSASGYPNCPNLISNESKQIWSEIVSGVQSEGSKIFCQLWHVGGRRKLGMPPDPELDAYTPSGFAKTNSGQRPTHEMSQSDIDELVSIYANDAKICEDLGFDGIEIHGAHEYLVDHFFWEETNIRKDDYGGTLINRTKFAQEIINACRNVTSKDFVIGLRFSQWKQSNFEAKLVQDKEELRSFINALKGNLDFFHASTRRYWEPEFDDSPKTLSRMVKEYSDLPVIAVGSVGLNKDFIKTMGGDPETKLADISKLYDGINNDFDLIAIGRAMLSEPEWGNKVKDGLEKTIVPFTKHFAENYI